MSATDASDLLAAILRFAFAAGLILFLVLMVRVMTREIDLATRDTVDPRQADPTLSSLIVIEPGSSNLTVGQSLLIRKRAVLGRSDECDIVLDDPSVSAEHAAVFVDAGSWFVEDFQSTNGTRVSARPVAGVALVESGALLQFGRIRMRLMC